MKYETNYTAEDSFVKRIAALILSLVMIFGMCTVAFAASKKLNYLVIGDSIAHGEGIANPGEACYGRMVANTNGYNYRNLGIDGITTSDLLLLINSSSEMKNEIKKADIISVSIGGNNFLRSNLLWLLVTIVFGNLDEVNKTADGIYDDLGKIIPAIKELNPDAVILMQTVYNPWKAAWISGIYQKGVDALNSAIRRYLKDNPGSYEIVDVAAAFAASDKDLIAADTIHPNGEGNKLIAKTVLKKLKQLGLGSKTEPVIAIEPIEKVSLSLDNNLRLIRYYLNTAA